MEGEDALLENMVHFSTVRDIRARPLCVCAQKLDSIEVYPLRALS